MIPNHLPAPGNRFYAWYFSRQMLVVVIRFAGDRPEVPDESRGGKKPKTIVSQIDFPPVKTLSGTTPELVVIVMPTFAKSNYSEEKIIAAIVTGVIAAAADQMRQRIDARRGMKQHYRTNHEAPDY